MKILKRLLMTFALLTGVTLGQSFTFSGYQWNKDGVWGAPGGGTLYPANVYVLPNTLVLQMNQSKNSSGAVISSDAEVISTQRFGYGTFIYTAAVYPVVSGQVASGFLYYNNSQTEIDSEQTGDFPNVVWVTNYAGVTNKQYSEVTGIPQLQFHTFKIVWKPTEVDYYVDGALKATHYSSVPSAPAYFLFNFWGANSTAWGGLATMGTRYMYISSFSYSPQY